MAVRTTSFAQQTVIAAPPPALSPLLLPKSAESDENSEVDQNPTLDSPFKVGSLVLRPHYLYRFLYSTGLQAEPGQPTTTYLNVFSPGVLAEIGSHLTVDYTPTWDVYTSKVFRDTLEHFVNVAAVNSYDGWSAQFTQSYDSTDQALIETGQQTSEQDYNTTLKLTHDLSSQFFTESNFGQDLRYAVGFPDSKEWTNLNWLHYRESSQFDFAAGIGFGYLTEAHESDTTYDDPQLRLTWTPGRKLTVDVEGGSEHREFYGHPKTGLTTPTYSLTANYSLFDTTQLSLSAGRQVDVSYIANQSTRDTHWTAGVIQRFLVHYTLSANVTNTSDAYISTLGSTGTRRSDSDISYSFRLGWSFPKRGTLALIVQKSRNTSSAQQFGFSSSQIGFEIGYQY